ncbi:MAG TPA: hypothetical protein VGH38_16180 [Bryobacteraceae bacterium]
MRNRWWLALIAGAIALILWVVTDLGAAGSQDLTNFDSHAVARLETDMWRSYYARNRVALFGELGELLRTQYHMAFWSSSAGAFHAARAAVVFQRGSGRAEYERALPDLRSFYALIRKGSSVPFDVEDAARCELEWWIVHRERSRHQPGDLEHALAALQARLYRRPEAAFEDHAKARADAMMLCDAGNAAGFVSEADWTRINVLLDRSWGSLRAVVSAGAK